MTNTERLWCDRVRAWRSSGLSAERFASGEDYAASTLRYWASRLRHEASKGVATPPIPLARVELVSPARTTALVVEVGSARIAVPSGFDHRLLRDVVAALTAGGEA
jgi:hypothetical protein